MKKNARWSRSPGIFFILVARLGRKPAILGYDLSKYSAILFPWTAGGYDWGVFVHAGRLLGSGYVGGSNRSGVSSGV